MKSRFKIISAIAGSTFALLSVCLPTSCASKTKPYDLSQINYETYGHTPTLFVYPQADESNATSDPSQISISQLEECINEDLDIKQDLLNEVIYNAPKLNGKVTTDDFDVSIDLSAEDPSTTFNYVDPAALEYDLVIQPSIYSKYLVGETRIPASTYTIQAFPDNFFISLTEQDYESFTNNFKVDLSSPLYFNNLFDINDKKEMCNILYDKMLSYEINTTSNEVITVQQYIETTVKQFILRELNEQYPQLGYNNVPINMEYDLKLNLNNLFYDNFDYFFHTKHDPINFSTYLTLPVNKFHSATTHDVIPFHVDNMQLLTDEHFDLSRLAEYDKNSSLTSSFKYYVNNNEIQQGHVEKQRLEADIKQELNSRLLNVLDDLPIISSTPQSDWYVINFDLNDQISPVSGLPVPITVKLTPNTHVNTPFKELSSYEFTFDTYMSNRMVSLNDQDLITDLNTYLDPTTSNDNIIYIDAENPNNVTIDEVKDGVSKNYALMDKIDSCLDDHFNLDFSHDDFEIDFYSSGQHAVTAGDYSIGAGGKNVYFFLTAASSSSKLKDDSQSISGNETPILINVRIDNSQYDLNNLPADCSIIYKDDKNTPLDLLGLDKKYPNLKKVPKVDIQQFLAENGAWNKIFIAKLATVSKAVTYDDYVLTINSQDEFVDLSRNDNAVSVIISPNPTSSIFTGQKTLTFHVAQASQKQCDINSITYTYSNTIFVPSMYPAKVSTNEIKNAVYSGDNIQRIKNEVNAKICADTSLDSVSDNDYSLSFVLHLDNDQIDLTNEKTVSGVLLVSASQSSTKLLGQFNLSIKLKATQIPDSVVKYNLSVYPTPNNTILSHRFDYHVSGSKCGGDLSMSSLDINFSYDKDKLYQKYRDEYQGLNSSLTLEKLSNDGIITSPIIGSLTGTFDAWCISTHIDWHNLGTLQIQYGQQNHFEAQHNAIGTHVGFFSGDNRNNTNDDFFKAFHFLVEFGNPSDTSTIRLTYRYASGETPATLRWGVRGMGNMYSHSNNRYDSQVGSAKNQTWN